MTNMELIGLIAAVITIVNYFGLRWQKSFQIETVRVDAPKIFRIIRLVQSTGVETVWELIRDVSLLAWIVILGYDVALVVALVVEGNKEIFSSFGFLIILIVIIVFPILSLIDDYRTELKLRRGEPSKAFKWTEIEIVADYDTLLIRCLQVLSDIGARVTHYNAVIGAVVAELPRNKIVIEIRQLQNDHYTVYIASDSKMPSVRVDFGNNQKNVDECTKRLLGYR